jgi:hypothetical protein
MMSLCGVLAGALDWMPWQLGHALRILMLIAMAVGAIYVTLYFMDLTLGGLGDTMRDGVRRYGEWRARRRLRPK